jgi:hypothetical protein
MLHGPCGTSGSNDATYVNKVQLQVDVHALNMTTTPIASGCVATLVTPPR